MIGLTEPQEEEVKIALARIQEEVKPIPCLCGHSQYWHRATARYPQCYHADCQRRDACRRYRPASESCRGCGPDGSTGPYCDHCLAIVEEAQR